MPARALDLPARCAPLHAGARGCVARVLWVSETNAPGPSYPGGLVVCLHPQRVLRQSWPSPSHVAVKRGVEAGEFLLQARELGLALRGRTVRTCQRGRDTLDLLHLLTDDVVCCLHLGHAVVDTGGQALELSVRTAATVGIEVTLE